MNKQTIIFIVIAMAIITIIASVILSIDEPLSLIDIAIAFVVGTSCAIGLANIFIKIFIKND